MSINLRQCRVWGVWNSLAKHGKYKATQKMKKKSWIKLLIRSLTMFKAIVPGIIWDLSWKFHQNPMMQKLIRTILWCKYRFQIAWKQNKTPSVMLSQFVMQFLFHTICAHVLYEVFQQVIEARMTASHHQLPPYKCDYPSCGTATMLITTVVPLTPQWRLNTVLCHHNMINFP